MAGSGFSRFSVILVFNEKQEICLKDINAPTVDAFVIMDKQGVWVNNFSENS